MTSNDLEKVTGPLEGITGCRGFLLTLSTIPTYQALGILSSNYSTELYLHSSKSPLEIHQTLQKLFTKPFGSIPTCQLTALCPYTMAIACEPIIALFPTM